MRIISGRAGGRRLVSPRGHQIRPVLDQVKEAVFNILFDVKGLAVLDVFAGTGSIALEAVSRGAASAAIIDNNREACSVIRKNIKLCGFGDICRLMPLDAKKALKKLSKEGAKFDLIFVDPPYLKNLVNQTIRDICELGLATAGGMIITEHHPKEPVEGLPACYHISDQRKYGQTIITFISHERKGGHF